MAKNHKSLAQFGFRFERGAAHSSRTMLLDEQATLLSYVDREDASKGGYLRATEEESCLAKRSGKTGSFADRHLAEFYSLDTAHFLFRVLRNCWMRDFARRPMLAILCAYARDSIFRSTASFIIKFPEGTAINNESLKEFIDSHEPGRLNIRLFMTVGDTKKKGADTLSDKPNIKWAKDRGKDMESAPWYQSFKNERINDDYLTLAEKRAALGNV